MIPPQTVTRFAPSPTGFLHLGHVLNAIYVWGTARAHDGEVLLRIEDHDRGRYREAYERAILEDLDWLGFVPDRPLVRQSDHPERYARHAEQLRDRTYWCSCTRKMIAAVEPVDDELRYPGTCRAAGLVADDARALGLRVKIDDREIVFDDVRLGEHQHRPSQQCGDILIRDRQGDWTYQFAVTVDDLVEGITLVVRGEDLLSSTGRQILLREMLGDRAPPVFLHHGLIQDAAGRKLSKEDDATGIRLLRQAGRTPEDVIGLAAAAGGIVTEPRPIPVDELASLVQTDR